MLSNVRIVLVGTTHAGNIGAVARAMKNMGMSRLYLVAPRRFPAAEATARAAGADDLLAGAVVCTSLAEAIADCHWVIGTSTRRRTIAWPRLQVREFAPLLLDEAVRHRVAIVFGREHAGLTNDELAHCQHLLSIPCDPRFSSLNLAQAVQIVAYELYTECRVRDRVQREHLATFGELESFYGHLFETLRLLGILTPVRSNTLQRRLRRLYNRARLEKNELDILRGILTATQEQFYRRSESDKH